MQPAQNTEHGLAVTIEVDGISYFSAADVARDCGVTRQTLWRWRGDGKIPQGVRYRDKQVLFTAEDLNRIREFAHRIKPVAGPDIDQLRLFGKKKGGT
jgi:hypothetical protein